MGQPPPAQLPNPALPATINEDELTNHMGILDTILSDIFTAAGGSPLQPAGLELLRLLSLIVVSWTGLRIAFSGGSWSFWEIARLVITLSIPLGMLRFYNVDIPAAGIPFPMIFPSWGNFIGGTFVRNTPATMFSAFTNLFERVIDTISNIWNTTSVWDVFDGGTALFGGAAAFVVLPTFCLLLILIFCFAYAQVLYAKVVVAILIFLGPVLIPFFVFQPLSFLFWGWLRSLFIYSLYGAVAGAMLYVWSSISLAYVNTFINTTFDFSSLGWSVVWFVSIVPLAVAAVLSATKVGEIASSLVSGGGGGGMNVAGMATTAIMAATGGAGKIAAVAGKPK